MKVFLVATACSLALEGWAQAAASSPRGLQEDHPKTTIENRLYRVEVDSGNGVIRRVLDNTSGIDLFSEPRLADNFRLLIPLPDLEGNYISGSQQKLSALEREPESLL